MSGRSCRDMKKRDKYLICSIAAVVVYFAASVALALHGCYLPDALTIGWYAFWGTEIWHIARIKINDKE